MFPSEPPSPHSLATGCFANDVSANSSQQSSSAVSNPNAAMVGMSALEKTSISAEVAHADGNASPGTVFFFFLHNASFNLYISSRCQHGLLSSLL